MNDDRNVEDDRNDDRAEEVVGSEGGAAPWGGSSRVDKEESAPEERSPGDNEEPAWTPSERPQKT
jgi:hypothetical protein